MQHLCRFYAHYAVLCRFYAGFMQFLCSFMNCWIRFYGLFMHRCKNCIICIFVYRGVCWCTAATAARSVLVTEVAPASFTPFQLSSEGPREKLPHVDRDRRETSTRTTSVVRNWQSTCTKLAVELAAESRQSIYSESTVDRLRYETVSDCQSRWQPGRQYDKLTSFKQDRLRS